MIRNGQENGVHSNPNRVSNVPNENEIKPTYALEHLATFKIKNESEIRNPKEKMKVLIELDKTGGILPQKMYMCFSGQWLLMLDSDMKEIENFPGTMITAPTAFISEDPLEVFNNILIFTVPGISLVNTEMHVFQVTDVSAVLLVEDLKELSKGNIITIDHNKSPISLPKPEKHMHNGRDQYGIAVAAAEMAAEKNAQDKEQTDRDILVINHCFEDIERFVARLQYAAEALKELQSRNSYHNPHGEGLLVLRSRPPTQNEFQDILAKQKLALNYIIKLQNHFKDIVEPISHMFASVYKIVNACNDVHNGSKIPETVINPLLKRETVTFLTSCLNESEKEFWFSLGDYWTLPKDQFKEQGSYHPIFYDDWSPDWVVDEEVPYLPPAIKKNPTPSPQLHNHATWLIRLESRNVKIAEVLYNKTANNDKELNVIKGEYLEIIEDSHNWWKARNSFGNIGYVPNTILKPHNFDIQTSFSGMDSDSVTSLINESDPTSNGQRNAISVYVAPTERESMPPLQQTQVTKSAMPRSYSMPNVPVPPPMPPPESPTTPTGTMKRNMAAAGAMAAMRARNDFEPNDEALMLQGTVNEELKYTLLQREKRKDLEILKTPEIFINQKSSSNEVEEWLRAKGFSNTIIMKLRGLNGEELFALSPHIIEGYFGQKESRRLISQIVLQKNICEYKTIRSSELSAKLAKARQKADNKNNNGYEPNEIF